MKYLILFFILLLSPIGDVHSKVRTKAFERVFPITATDNRNDYYILLVNTSSKDYLCYVKPAGAEPVFVLILKKTVSDEVIKVNGMDTKFEFVCKGVDIA